jgi:hypothetical protein
VHVPVQPAAIKVPVQAHFGQLDTMKGFSDPEVRSCVSISLFPPRARDDSVQRRITSPCVYGTCLCASHMP